MRGVVDPPAYGSDADGLGRVRIQREVLAGEPYRLPSEAEWEYAARAGASGEELDEEAVP